MVSRSAEFGLNCIYGVGMARWQARHNFQNRIIFQGIFIFVTPVHAFTGVCEGCLLDLAVSGMVLGSTASLHWGVAENSRCG